MYLVFIPLGEAGGWTVGGQFEQLYLKLMGEEDYWDFVCNGGHIYI